MTDDIAAVIARLTERDLRERWDEDVLALIAAYEVAEKALAAERGAVSFWQTAESEAKIRAERAEQVAEGTRQMFEASQREHEVRLSEARKRIEALVADYDYDWQHHEVILAARAFLASTGSKK